MTKDPFKLQKIEEARITSGAGSYNSSREDGMNGAFLFIHGSKRLACIASDQGGWEHVSVTDQTTRRSHLICPIWQDMTFIKRRFWDDEETVVEFHVPMSEWINEHPGCLHLWKPVGVEIPRPPALFVGLPD